MARFKITLEYDGSRYSGWQMQKGERTIQGALIRAGEETFRTDEIEFYGAGRTDSGVHALGQAAHLEVETRLTTQAILRKLNDELPYDINILSVEKVTPMFHARHDAVARSYIYQISHRRTAFGKHYSWWLRDEVDPAKMKEAAKLFVGLQDFRSFTDDNGDQTSTQVEMKRLDVHHFGSVTLLHFVGSHFLWKMVRRITGVLAQAGAGTVRPKTIEGYFREKSNEPATFTAPPSGLYLHAVYYPGDATDYELKTPETTFFPNVRAKLPELK